MSVKLVLFYTEIIPIFQVMSFLSDLPISKLLDRLHVHTKSIAVYGASLYVIMEILAYAKWRHRVYWLTHLKTPCLDGKPLEKYEEFFCRNMLTQPRPKEYFESIFQAPLHLISRERAVHLLCYYMTMREMEDYPQHMYPTSVLNKSIHILEVMENNGHFSLHSDPATAWLPKSTLTECTLPRSDVVDFVRVGRASIDAFYKPIPVRLIMLIMRRYAEREMVQMGFTRTVGESCIVYWKRPQMTKRDDSRAIRPLFFLHGLGFGIVPYVHFIRSLLDDRREIVVPEWPNISLGWEDNRCDVSPTPKQYADSLFTCIKTLRNSDGSRATSVDTIGHSWGTAVTHFYKAHRPTLLARQVFIDPIGFATSFHKWATFAHEYCLRSWSELFAIQHEIGLFETFGMWFVKGDINVQCLARRAIYISDILSTSVNNTCDENCLVVLSGKDPVIPSHDIMNDFKRNGTCTTIIDEKWRHGEFLFGKDSGNIWQKITDWVSPRELGKLRRVKSDPSFRGHLFGVAS